MRKKIEIIEIKNDILVVYVKIVKLEIKRLKIIIKIKKKNCYSFETLYYKLRDELRKSSSF